MASFDRLYERSDAKKWSHPEIADLFGMFTSLDPGMESLIYNMDLPYEERLANVDVYLKGFETVPELSYTRRDVHVAPGCPEEPDAETEVVLYRPADWNGSDVLPVLFVCGGGAQLLTMIEFDMWYQYADRLGCTCVCPRYRGSYVKRYPAALNDLHAGYAWMVEHAEELKIDPDKVVLTGPSSGSNLALSLCYRLKRYGYSPRGCVTEASFTDNRPIWPTSTIREGALWSGTLMWRASIEYLGPNNVSCYNDPEMYPMYATPEDAVGLPPTFLHCDSEDQGSSAVRAYCDTLSVAGVYHECHDWGGTIHAVLRNSYTLNVASGTMSDYARRYMEVFEGNVRDCWKYDLRRQWIREELEG